MSAKRSLRRQVRTPFNLVGDRLAKQIEREVDAGTFPRNVVLKICVQPLVTQIKLGSKRHNEQVEIERLETEVAAQLFQPSADFAGVCVGRKQRRTGSSLQQFRSLFLADVESAIRIGRALLTVDLLCFSQRPAKKCIQL